MARRTPISAIIILAIIAFFSVSYLFSSSESSRESFGSGSAPAPLTKDSASPVGDLGHIDSSILMGESIAPKLENATIKYVPTSPPAPSVPLLILPTSELSSVAPPGSCSTP